MLLHALYKRLCTAPLNRLPCYGDLEVIVTLLLLLFVHLLTQQEGIQVAVKDFYSASQRTLQRGLQKCNIYPGFSSSIMHMLVFDKMALKTKFVYNRERLHSWL